MPYTAIQGTDNIGNSRTTINDNNAAFDGRITSLEDTRTTINDGITTLTNLTNSSDYILQQVTSVVNAGNIISTTSYMRNTVDDTGLSPLSITRKDTGSKLLFELTGGCYKLSTGKIMQTYFYVSLNNAAYIALNNGQPVEYVSRTGGGYHIGPHSARSFYTVNNPSITTVNLAVYASFSDTGQNWNLITPVNVPIVLSITEIK